MLPVKIIIVDDEPGILLLLQSILSELEGALVAGIAENAADAINLVKNQSPDLALLDIELPDMLGIDLAKKLREIKPDLVIVFVTAHREHSLDAFRLYAVDYILKPIDEKRVKKTFQHIQQTLRMPDRKSKPQTATISIKSGNQQVLIKLNEIFYIEKVGRHTLFCCINGKFKTKKTLHELEQGLGTTFFRSHKSYIINVLKIERIIAYTNYYEIKFKNYENRASLSRDRFNLLNERLKDCTIFSRRR